MQASEMISRVFKNISPEDMQTGTQVVSSWRETVGSISRNGAKLAAHSHVVDLKNGILLVEADHSGWIQMLQLHQKYILTGLQRKNKSLNIQSLAFRLTGSDAHLAETAPFDMAKERARLQKQFDAEEEALKKTGYAERQMASKNQQATDAKNSINFQNSAKSSTLPPELQQIFDKFKSEILTNQS
ncbi:MAG: DUF721 domain-containing protein [Treponema sp.]|nr:DUF721 domain-containing protein [Treponema sp.]